MGSQTKQELADNYKICNKEKERSDALVTNMEKGLNSFIVQLFEMLLYQDALTHCMINILTKCLSAPKYEDVIIKCMKTKFHDTPYPEATIYSRYTAQR